MSKKYQVYRDVKGKFRFRLLAENNRIIAVGQAYEHHISCLNGIKSIQNNCDAQVEDMTVDGERFHNPKYQVFYDEKCKYRFHLNAKNGEIIAQSEGYESKEGCMKGINAVKGSCNAEIEDLSATEKGKEEVADYDEIKVPVVELKPVEVVKEAVVEAKPAEVQVVTPAVMLEPKVEMPPAVVAAPEEMKMPESTSPAVTVLELQNLTGVNKGELVSFKGKLYRSDNRKGIPYAKIDIHEHDRSLLGDDYLAHGTTDEEGSFSIDWKARSLAWFDNTGKIYARFKGNEQANASKSAIQTITIN
jgi:uncharacterized protein YegP (UPF0339 family)